MSASIMAAAVGIAPDALATPRVRSRFFLGMSLVLLAIGGSLIVASFAICTFVLPNTELGRSLVYGLYELMR